MYPLTFWRSDGSTYLLISLPNILLPTFISSRADVDYDDDEKTQTNSIPSLNAIGGLVRRTIQLPHFENIYLSALSYVVHRPRENIIFTCR